MVVSQGNGPPPLSWLSVLFCSVNSLAGESEQTVCGHFYDYFTKGLALCLQ